MEVARLSGKQWRWALCGGGGGGGARGNGVDGDMRRAQGRSWHMVTWPDGDMA